MAEDILGGVKESVISGNATKTKELVEKAVRENIDVSKILNEGLIAGMNVVGVKFKNNEFYVPEVLIAARAMHAGMGIIEPLIAKAGIQPLAKLAIGTVKGDLHDIGKNLVIMMWKGAGFEVEDLGIDVPPEKFVEAAKKGAKVLGLSALLTTTMVAMKDVIEALKKEGLKDQVKVVIGGAPITQSYADEIGADGYAPDAASAVDKVKELLNI
ncbi:MAG: corrinoid protein [Candidatus Omnitrophica bacterium]|nr:corrinoid protein [Candidatus Omnitrophota bacterium]MCM8776765.1 corrinoid protein [Candidatus Omnitrophota bacterium]